VRDSTTVSYSLSPRLVARIVGLFVVIAVVAAFFATSATAETAQTPTTSGAIAGAQESPPIPGESTTVPTESTSTTTTSIVLVLSPDSTVVDVPSLDDEQVDYNGPAPSYPLPPGFAAESGVLKKPRTARRIKSDINSTAALAQQAHFDAAHLAIEMVASDIASDRLKREEEEARRQLDSATAVLRDRSVLAYLGRRVPDEEAVVDTVKASELSRAFAFLDRVVELDQQAIDEYSAARARLEKWSNNEVRALAAIRQAYVANWGTAADARNVVGGLRVQLVGQQLGVEQTAPRFVFPVLDTYAFWDGWNAPRMVGTPSEHLHQGTDIMASMGTPLLAVERGIVFSIGEAGLGGQRVWLQGASGTRYYYAHLSRFVDGMVEGQIVEPGQVIGYVGDTGNARGGSPHLHFEIHPPASDLPVNPFLFLTAAATLDTEFPPLPSQMVLR